MKKRLRLCIGSQTLFFYQEYTNLDSYDNIRLQTGSFDEVETFREFIRNVTGSNLDALKLDIDTERFLTYSL